MTLLEAIRLCKDAGCKGSISYPGAMLVIGLRRREGEFFTSTEVLQWADFGKGERLALSAEEMLRDDWTVTGT